MSLEASLEMGLPSKTCQIASTIQTHEASTKAADFLGLGPSQGWSKWSFGADWLYLHQY